MQYFTTTIVFTVARPYRKPMYTNLLFMLYFIFSFSYFFKVFLFPDEFSNSLFDVVEFENPNIKYYIFIICIANFVISYMVESGLIPLFTRIYYRAKYYETLRKIQTKKYDPNLQELNDMKKETKILEI